MNYNRIGIIGYGEVGQAFAEGLSSPKGVVTVFDIRFGSDDAPDAIAALAEAKNLKIEPSIKALVQSSDLVISAVTCDQALKVAQASAEHMRKGQTYVDLNTVTPQLKENLNHLIAQKGAEFIEVAILGTISSYGFKSPMLACGKTAPEFGGFLNSLGFSVKVLTEKIGTASSMKMLRSIFAKGVESLLFEMLVAAEKCDLLEPVMDAIVTHMDHSSFLNIAETWITTNVVHAQRRAEEMDHVIETLENLNMQPVMSKATQERLVKCASMGLRGQIKDAKLMDYQSVIKLMVKNGYS